MRNTDFYKYFDKLVSCMYAAATLASFSDNPLTIFFCSCQKKRFLIKLEKSQGGLKLLTITVHKQSTEEFTPLRGSPKSIKFNQN